MIEQDQAYKAYQEFLAITMHFFTDKYDYFKYDGKVKATNDSFQKRKDRHFFLKLSRLEDYQGLIIANCLVATKRPWVGSVISEEGKDIYKRWARNNGSRTYLFEQSINKVDGTLLDSVKCKNGDHPKLLDMYIRGDILLEDLIIVDHFLSCFSVWSKQLNSTIIWEGIEQKASKYKRFIRNVNEQKLKTILKERLQNDNGYQDTTKQEKPTT